MKQWPQWGVFAIIILILGHSTNGENNRGFVARKGVNLMLNDSPLYGNGFNAYWLMSVASDPSQRFKVSKAFQQAKSHGLYLARTWAFSDGGDSPLQYSPGNYSETMFKGLDFVIYEAGKYKIKLILSLVNNYKDYGGKAQYVNWAINQGNQTLSSEDDFYTNNVTKGYYKNHIKTVLSRKNTLTGIAYKDDPTIMAWELMNEPRCQSDLSGKTIQCWVGEMASFLKSIDKKHLVEIGLEGFYGPSSPKKLRFNPNFQVGTDFIANNQLNDVDFLTLHSYPDQWLTGKSDAEQLSFLKKWVKSHIQDAQKILKKPLILAEFGKTKKDPGYNVDQRNRLLTTVYAAIYASAKGGGAAAGGMFWHLLTEGMDNFRDGYEIVFSESKSTSDLITRQSKQLIKLSSGGQFGNRN